jgi:hypothetical protein
MALDSKSYSSGHFLFQLDSGNDPGAAYLKSVAGGMMKGAVLEENAGPSQTQFKHLGTVEIDPIQIEIGMAMSKPVLDWIKGSWNKEFTRMDGQIIHADFNLNSRLEQWFTNALIAETKFPTLDGAAREPAYLGVTIHPEEVQVKKGDGHKVMGVTGLNQKRWLPSNFALHIEGIDCRYVNRIDSFSVTQKIRPLYTGVQRTPELEPTGIDFSNLVVYLAVEHAQDFFDWHEQFVVRGSKSTTSERPGFIEFLGPDNSTVIFTINLNQVGIHRLTIEKSEAQAEQIKRAKVELYLESMDLVYDGSSMR